MITGGASIKNIAYLKRAVARLVKAEVASSWVGAAPPEDHVAIERELADAKRMYAQAIARLETP
jgi:hypothetical protein